MTDLSGQSLGRYHIIEQLGEGGMAIVYKAYDTRLERDVAIKMIRRGAFPADHIEQILKRFEREAQALARLSHTNILKVLDYGEYEGSSYLVLEYLPGGTLKLKLGKPIPWRDAFRTLIPVAEALKYAHAHGIIHRDIKPSNILLTETNQPLLTDFGIAKILEAADTTTLTGTGVGIGTPEYMAPEQWTGQAGAQSDVYSLGIVLYEMITGRKPYVADTPAAILLKQATEPLPRPTLYVSDLPESIEKFLIKALAKNPQDRFQNMADLATAMEKLLQGKQTVLLSGFAPAVSMPEGETYATVEQDASRATHIQGATRDTMSVSRVEIADKNTSYPTAPPKGKGATSNWIYFLAAGIGGLLIISLCIGIAFSTGIFGHAQPLQPEVPVPAIQSDNVSFPTEIIPSQTPVEPQMPPTDVPTLIPTNTDQPTYTPPPTYTPQPTYTPLPVNAPPVVDSIGIPQAIVCDGRRYDVPVYFHDPDGDAYQIYWELIYSKKNSPLYSTLRDFVIDSQIQINGAVYNDWIEWNTSGDEAQIRVYIYDRTGLRGWKDFYFHCSN